MINRELNFDTPSPLLYLIATPIGNLSEMSPRSLEVINQMDYIAAEDTRNARKLLSYFKIEKNLISCHEHNEVEAAQYIIKLLKEGKKVAYMSDAGYPCVSDPGVKLVDKCLEAGIKISTVNGASAAINALTVSGLDSTHFYFEGFLPVKTSEKEKELLSLKPRKETLILYESPHRIGKTLKSLYSVLGERKAVICRELTKLHEEIIRGTLKEFSEIDENTLIGEMVIVIEGNKEEIQTSEEGIIEFLKSSDSSKKTKEIVQEAAIKFNVNKNYVYDLYLKKIKD